MYFKYIVMESAEYLKFTCEELQFLAKQGDKTALNLIEFKFNQFLTEKVAYDICHIGNSEIDKKYSEYEMAMEFVKPGSTRFIKSEEKDVQKAHFNCTCTEEELAFIFNGLVNGGFIAPDSILNDWLYIFKGSSEITNSDKIKWTAKNTRTKCPSKRSLIDFLVLMGVHETEIKAKINECFSVEGAKKYSPQNYNGLRNWGKDCKSEYHNKLKQLTKRQAKTKVKNQV